MPGDQDRDIKTGTCSMSIYKRRGPSSCPLALPLPSTEDPIPNTNWRNGNGVVGGWDQIINGDCSFLSGGEQRNWWFSGEEAWDFPLVAEAKKEVEVEAENTFGGPGTLLESGEAEAAVAQKERSNI